MKPYLTGDKSIQKALAHTATFPLREKKMLTVFASFFLSWIPHLLPAVLLENGCAEYDLKFEQGREGVCVSRFHGEAVLAESP